MTVKNTANLIENLPQLKRQIYRKLKPQSESRTALNIKNEFVSTT